MFMQIKLWQLIFGLSSIYIVKHIKLTNKLSLLQQKKWALYPHFCLVQTNCKIFFLVEENISGFTNLLWLLHFLF